MIGKIAIEKIKGANNERYPVGNKVTGYTHSFKEGERCYIESTNHWFLTSIVRKIRWEDNEFDTLYSTYKFKFEKDENSNL